MPNIRNWNDPWDTTPHAALQGFSSIIPTVYGRMIVNRYDTAQVVPLLRSGFSLIHGEVRFLGRVLSCLEPNGLVVVDVGANIGVVTLALAKLVGLHGKIHAFEPQRIIFNMLAGSVALNSLTNVFCYNMAIGDRSGVIEIPQFDYFKPMSFGSIEFGLRQVQKLDQERGNDQSKLEYVPLATLDSFGYHKVDLLKIDAEGMEMQVLEGGRETIGRCRPIISAEWLKVDRHILHKWLTDHGYVVYDAGGGNDIAVPSEREPHLPPIPDLLAGSGAIQS